MESKVKCEQTDVELEYTEFIWSFLLRNIKVPVLRKHCIERTLCSGWICKRDSVVPYTEFIYSICSYIHVLVYMLWRWTNVFKSILLNKLLFCSDLQKAVSLPYSHALESVPGSNPYWAMSVKFTDHAPRFYCIDKQK